jgi:hypothetical protein
LFEDQKGVIPMGQLKVESSQEARQFLTSVPLRGRRAGFESAEELKLPIPTYEDGTEQVVTVGSQIAEYSKRVSEARRAQITNSFLLAQLAANKRIAEGGATKDWYDAYVSVLANTGWITETGTVSDRDVSGSSSEVHEEIIPIITAALGPAVAAAALVTKILQGLADMEKDNPWITLFSKESQRATANQFQISYADVPEGKEPQISVTCFELDASHSVTQVLFFKFSNSKAKLRHFGSKLSMNTAVFDRVQDIVADRVAEYAANYVAAIPI